MKMNWNHTTIALLLGFLMGLLLAPVLRRPPHGGPPWRHGPPHGMMDRFADDLDLTPAQRDQVAKVFESNRGKIDQAFSLVRPQLREIREDTHQQIRKLLTPAQQKKFDAQEAEMEKHAPPDGGPFPPPVP